MTKEQLIEKHGLKWYEEHLANCNIRNKERYKNDLEYREYKKDCMKKREAKEHQKEYQKNDLNTIGKTKQNIRKQSRYILFVQRKHTKLKDYQIHHCFGYDDPSKFIYIPKSLHYKIHQYLRDNNIVVNSNHFDYIKHLINNADEYTYISI